MKAAVIDDEPLARSRLKRMLKGQNVDVVAEGENGQQAIEIAMNEMIDLMFIDINMPIKNGLDAVREIDRLIESPPAIIFCTAYDQYAIDAFATNAVSYLLKPFSEDELIKSLAQAEVLTRVQIGKLSVARDESYSISYVENGALRNLNLMEVAFFYSENKHVFAALVDGGAVFIDKPLKQLESDTQSMFVRVHRNSLVHIQYISSLYRDDLGQAYLTLNCRENTVLVSRRHYLTVKKCLS